MSGNDEWPFVHWPFVRLAFCPGPLEGIGQLERKTFSYFYTQCYMELSLTGAIVITVPSRIVEH